jgi:hypothetical protein
MLKKLFVTAAAAAAVSVPLAGVAWANPPSNPGSNGNGNDGGIGKGGIPTRIGAVFDSIVPPPGAPPPNPNGVGEPVTPGTVINGAKGTFGTPTPVALGKALTVLNSVYPPPGGTSPTNIEVGPTAPGLAVKTFTPGCSSGNTATGTLPTGATVDKVCNRVP